jgi:hypothetical protein
MIHAVETRQVLGVTLATVESGQTSVVASAAEVG